MGRVREYSKHAIAAMHAAAQPDGVVFPVERGIAARADLLKAYPVVEWDADGEIVYKSRRVLEFDRVILGGMRYTLTEFGKQELVRLVWAGT